MTNRPPDPPSAAAPAGYDVAALRAAEFPWAETTIWLDHASIGPLPERTRRRLDEFTRKRAEPFRLKGEDMFGAFAEARRLAARLINATAEEIALTTNTTWGIAAAATGLPLASGDIVLVSHREFPANVYPWLMLEDRGISAELVPVTEQGWPDEERILERLEDPRVRALSISLTQFSTGYTVDLPRLSAATRRSGAFLVVDAIQALGQRPFDAAAVEIDVLSCGAQKWLLSPWGSGFMYVRRPVIAQMKPAVTGWMAFEGTDDFNQLTAYNPNLRPDARRFEMITLPFQDMAGMAESLGLLLDLGIEAIASHLRAIREPVLDWADRAGVPVTSPRDARGSGIVCLAPPNVAQAHQRLRAARIYASLREGVIRLAPHCYNTVDDMARVADVLAEGS